MEFFQAFVVLLIGVSASLSAEVAITKPLDIEPIAVKTNVLPEVSSNNVTGRSLIQNIRDVVLPFVVRQLGIIECMGADHATGGNFFESILGPGADAGGNYLCQPTCGGECVPTQGLGEAPRSLYYPFGCRCAPNRCDAHGPIVQPLSKQIFKILCVRDDRCTCASMGPPHAHTGFLCNWINLNTHLPVSIRERPLLSGYPPSYSPIRWCSCCPNVRPL
ncbi:unnamed protein product [Orchesella dallaii]|uniref:Uncharacterized protein n=1 Tax=Orchesella dallaii TaxID=48710 RepID=A0ABP1QXX9_9HEXA